MTDITHVPLQDDYEQELTETLADDAAALTINVDVSPVYTPSTTVTRAVINPGKDNMELVKVSDYDSSALTITIPPSGRAQPLYKGHSATVKEHLAGSKIIFSDNFEFWTEIMTAVNSKLDLAGGNAGSAFDLALSGNSFRIRRDGDDMKLRDNNQAEVTLASLASLSGSNDKVKISNLDTTEDYLENKIAAGDNVTITKTSPAGDEGLTIAAAAGNSVDNDFTSYERIEAGHAVSLRSQDTVENFVLSTLGNAGTEATFDADTCDQMVSCEIAQNKVAVLYDNGTDNKAYLVIGTVDAEKAITWGTPLEVSATAPTALSICKLEDDKLAISYVYGAQGYVRVATVSSTTPTLGSEGSISSGAADYTGVALLTTDKFAVCYDDAGAASAGKVKAVSVSDTTVTVEDAGVATFEAGGTDYIAVAQFDTDKVAVFYADAGDSNKGKGALCVAAGTTMSNNTPVEIDTNTSTNFSCAQLDTDEMIVCWTGGASAYVQARVASLSVLTISYGTVAAGNAAANGSITCDAIDSGTVYVAYEETGDSDGKFNELTIAGTAVTVGTQQTFNGSTNNVSSISLAKVSANDKFIILYKDEADSNKGNSEVYQLYDNTDNLNGYARTGIDAAASVSVRSEGIIGDQTSLTAGLKYYFSSTDGTLTTTVQRISAGVAKDTDELDIVINIMSQEVWDFFNTTNMTGAQATGLIDESNADDKHVHGSISPRGNIVGSSQRLMMATNANEVFDWILSNFTRTAGGLNRMAVACQATNINAFMYQLATPVTGIQFGDGKYRSFKTIWEVINITDDMAIGFGGNSITTFINSGHTGTEAGFKFTIDQSDSNKLYAVNADGSGVTATEITGITVTDCNEYAIDWDGASSAKFYVNGVLKATHTTNLPTGVAENCSVAAGMKGTGDDIELGDILFGWGW